MKFINSVKEKILVRKKTTALVVITGLVVLTLPFFVNAEIGDAVKGALFSIIGLIFSLILWFEGLLLQLAGTTIDTVLGSALAVHTSDVVQEAWALSRDVANMIFIIALLVIAFATIFNIEAYQYKALLPKLIMGVLLVNFSRTIATICIEFSNLLTAAFLNFDQSRTSTAVIMAILGVDSVSKLKSKAGVDFWIDDAGMLMALIAIVVIVGLLVVVLTAFAGMLILRTIMLLVLIVVSPLAFAMGVLPATKSMLDEWWQHFIQYILYTPLAAFGLYLSLRAAQEINNYGQEGGGGMLGVKPASITGKAAESASLSTSVIPITFPGDPRQVYNFCLVLGLLFFTVMMIQKAGGFLAAFGLGLAKMGVLALPKLAAGAGLWGGKKLLGGFGRRIQRGLAGAGKEGGLLERIGTKLGGKKVGEKFRNAGKYLSFLSPTVFAKAWNDLQDKKDRDAFSESSGWARTQMNKVPILGNRSDKTDYAYAAHEAEVEEEAKKLKQQQPNLGHAFLVGSMTTAARDGNTRKVEACMRFLSGRAVNNNEVQRKLAEDPEARKLLHSEDYLAKNPEYETSDFESWQDMVYHTLGKKHGRLVMQDIGEAGKDASNYAFSEGYELNLKTGEVEERDEGTREFAAAFENGKRKVGDLMANPRFNIFDEAYKVGDPDTKRLKVAGHYQIMALMQGLPADAFAERNFGQFASTNREALKENFEEFKKKLTDPTEIQKVMDQQIDEKGKSRLRRSDLGETDTPEGNRLLFERLKKNGEQVVRDFEIALREGSISAEMRKKMKTGEIPGGGGTVGGGAPAGGPAILGPDGRPARS